MVILEVGPPQLRIVLAEVWAFKGEWSSEKWWRRSEARGRSAFKKNGGGRCCGGDDNNGWESGIGKVVWILSGSYRR